MSVCKEQGWKSVLDVLDVQALGQQCIKTRHDFIMEISAPTLCQYTAHCDIHKCRLKLVMQRRQQHEPETLLAPLDQSWFKTDWGKVGHCSVSRRTEIWNSFLRDEGPFSSLSAVSLKACTVLECFSVRAPSVLKVIYRFYSNVSIHPEVSFGEGLEYFSKSMLNCILHHLKKLHSRRARVLNWPPWRPGVSTV